MGTYSSATGATSSATCTPCAIATACIVPGLAAPPPCYWNVSTLAGSGVAGWADGQGAAAVFNGSRGVSVDPASMNIYVGEYSGNRVRIITPSGNVTTVAGSGGAGFADGVGTAAQFFGPSGVRVGPNGNVYLADMSNHRVRKILPSGSVSTLAGSGIAAAGPSVNGIGTSAHLNGPSDIALDASGLIGFIVEQGGCRVRRIVLSTASVSTLAGNGTAGFADGVGSTAQLNAPTSAVWHPSGTLYVSDGENQRIRQIGIASTIVATLAGNGTMGGVDGRGTAATFNGPCGVALGGANFSILYVAEASGHRIRSVNLSSSLVQTIAGSGSAGFANAFGVAAVFNGTNFIATAPTGVLYTAEVGGHRVRQLTCVPCPASYFCSSGAPVPCPAGFYCPLFSVDPIPCPAGTASGQIGASTNSTCQGCGPGTFAEAGATNCTLCSAGKYSGRRNATSNSTCTDCAAGKASATAGASSNTTCMLCKAGTWSGTGAPVCTNCTAGNFSRSEGANSSSFCQLCGASNYSDAGASSCSTCTAGSYCPASGVRTPCPELTYSSAPRANSSSVCQSCRPGFACPLGSTEELALPCAPPVLFTPEPPPNITLSEFATTLGLGLYEFFACACAAPGFSLSPLAQQQELISGTVCANASAPPPTGCAWGLNATCERCPAHARCPGGAELHPDPGFWAPALASPPNELSPCSTPAKARCPGWAALLEASNGTAAGAAGACGLGYTGAVCESCAPSFFKQAGACLPCPGGAQLLRQVLPVAAFVLGLLAFFGVMLAFACMQRWRRDGGLWVALCAGGACCCQRRRCEKCPPLRGPQGVLVPVLQLCVWLWGAGQGAASLFNQALNEPVIVDLLPPTLLAPYKGLAALQFAGAAPAPGCTSAEPFSSLWGALCGAAALLLAMAAALPLLAAAPKDGRRHALLNGGLRLAGVALTASYGALVAAALAALVCTPTRPMELRAYALLDADGAALRAAPPSLPPLPSLEDVRAAEKDPLGLAVKAYAAAANCAPPPAAQEGCSLLSRTVEVAVLIEDEYKVCGEGAQVAAARAAKALLALLIAVPLAAPLLAWLPHAPRCCHRRRCCCGGGGGGVPVVSSSSGGDAAAGGGGADVGFTGDASPSAPAPAPAPAPGAAAAAAPPRPFAALHDALADPALENWAKWFTFANLELTLLVNVGVAYARRFALDLAANPAAWAPYAAVQGSIAAVYFFGALFSYFWQPYVAKERWRNPLTASFFLLSTLTASTNTALLLRGAEESAKKNGGARVFIVGVLPLLALLLLLVLLLKKWREALLEPDAKDEVWAPLAVLQAVARAHNLQAAVDAYLSFAQAAPEEPPPEPEPEPQPWCDDDDWESVTHDDGDRFFRHVGTGELSWWRPSGRYVLGVVDRPGLPDMPVWVDQLGGGVTFTNPLTGALAPAAAPPPAEEEEARAAAAERQRVARERCERALAAARAREARALAAFDAARGDLASAEEEEDGGAALLAALDARGRELAAAIKAVKVAERDCPPPQ